MTLLKNSSLDITGSKFMFDKDNFDEVYADSYNARAIKQEVYNQSKLQAKAGYEAFTKTQQGDDADGFTYVPSKKVKKSVQKQSASTKNNAMKTGAIMAGYDTKSKKYVYRYAMSGSTYKKDVDSFRKHCEINLKKTTYCAEENIIVSNPNIRFYYCIAFRIEAIGVVIAPPCGHHDPYVKCKQTLRLLGIEYVFRSSDL
jgi:hypothetical protein